MMITIVIKMITEAETMINEGFTKMHRICMMTRNYMYYDNRRINNDSQSMKDHTRRMYDDNQSIKDHTRSMYDDLPYMYDDSLLSV